MKGNDEAIRKIIYHLSEFICFSYLHFDQLHLKKKPLFKLYFLNIIWITYYSILVENLIEN